VIVAELELRRPVRQLFGQAEIVRVEPHPMQSSCPLTRIDLITGDGQPLAAIFKDLSPASRHAAPPSLHDGRREIDAYRSLTAYPELGTARFLGAHVDVARHQHWLCIEAVAGVPLWQSECRRSWTAAAQWLARLHSIKLPRLGDSGLTYDQSYFARWMPRALALAPDADLAGLVDCHHRAVRRLLGAAPVFIHGDFYPANLLVLNGPPVAICPIDFELAGHGPGVLDLAALVTGLGAGQTAAMVASYRDAVASSMSPDELDELLVCARLHLAIRWLGWLGSWEPPAHQQFDWVGEAHATATALGCLR
jgi:aminoglycoside phosphotransferase (APT) family kinase protein